MYSSIFFFLPNEKERHMWRKHILNASLLAFQTPGQQWRCRDRTPINFDLFSFRSESFEETCCFSQGSFVFRGFIGIIYMSVYICVWGCIWVWVWMWVGVGVGVGGCSRICICVFMNILEIYQSILLYYSTERLLARTLSLSWISISISGVWFSFSVYEWCNTK